MKVCVSTFGGDGGKSGISRYIVSLLAEFARSERPHRFDVLAYGRERDIFLPSGATNMEARCFGENLRSPLRNVLWHQTALPCLCRSTDCDVAFLPAANRRSPMRMPCPTVGTVHDFSSIHVQGKYDPARMFYIRQVLPFLARRLTRVLTVSESSRRDIVEYARVPPERVTVTPLAADSSVYKPGDVEEARARIHERYGIQGPFVLYTSRLEHPGKNHVRLIRAFDRLKEREKLPHRLVLAGSDWSGSEAIHREAKAARHAADIVFPGFVASSDLPALYRASELFVFPSLYEGFGLPILEAMSCGVPVACANVSSMPEVAGDAGVLFDPHDEEAIGDAMRRVLTDESLKAATAVAGLKRAAQFSWRRTAERTLDVLEEAAGG